MNYKNLNYEIETTCFSLARSLDAFAMNYKNLNYEIETISNKLSEAFTASMNYKNLNYEIETGNIPCTPLYLARYEL